MKHTKTNIKSIIYRAAIVIPLTLAWVSTAAIVLWLFFYLHPKDDLYDPLNTAAMTTIVLIYIGHIVAFSIVPLGYILSKYTFDKITLIAFSVAGALAVCMQYAFRTFSDGLGRIDCGNSCVASVVPVQLGQEINVTLLIVLLALLLAFISLAVFKYKKQLRAR